ncbi:MAG TPA: malto-oligosyltrehalose trehalohydrolase [Microvirga sp.]|nr:malto-oligosyltrehalose trehalohydrolase [Microvirga sp.]
MRAQGLDSRGRARRYPVGAEIIDRGVSFRVWAPSREAVGVVLEDGTEYPLEADAHGYFSAVLPVGEGARYRFRLDQDRTLYPDPASRFQPEGPHGPSQVVDAAAYCWNDGSWTGVKLEGQVAYEMHVGTFTPDGTWHAAIEKLPLLKEIGITLIEMMPVNEFPGRFGWGYDGVNLFAPTRLYGSPDDLRAFIDAAHGHAIGVILDVVYNHLGPDGNYLACFAPDYFTDRYENEWGEAINFDGPNAEGVREFFVSNAVYWIDEFHFDGLRLDATQSIFDSSDEHVVARISREARKAAGERSIVLIGENEPQHARFARPLSESGYGLDALWNDDLHHSAMVAVTGRNEAYYEDHEGSPQEFISAAKYGYLFQGQTYAHQRKRRGTPAFDLPPAAFVTFVQNHDQIANSGRGLRFHQLASPGRARAMTALLMLLPGTPMLFQGQEFWASTPFLYFADHKPELAELVRKGRREFVEQFPSVADPAMSRQLDPPESPATFEACRLDWAEFDRNAAAVALHRDLLRLRREDPVFSAQRRASLDGAVLGPEAFVLRFFGGEGNDRLLLVNFGRDLNRASFPEPLLAPPEGRRWHVAWSSENPSYGGGGTPPIETEAGWHLPGHATVVLAPTDP